MYIRIVKACSQVRPDSLQTSAVKSSVEGPWPSGSVTLATGFSSPTAVDPHTAFVLRGLRKKAPVVPTSIQEKKSWQSLGAFQTPARSLASREGQRCRWKAWKCNRPAAECPCASCGAGSFGSSDSSDAV